MAVRVAVTFPTYGLMVLVICMNLGAGTMYKDVTFFSRQGQLRGQIVRQMGDSRHKGYYLVEQPAKRECASFQMSK